VSTAYSWYGRNKERVKKAVQAGDRANPKRAAANHKRYRDNLRAIILKRLGGKCKCGFTDPRALQIDHVNGGGAADKRGKGLDTYYRHVLDKIAAGSRDYQILCANCNWIKRAERGEAHKGTVASRSALS
jgi:hypothetical protein